MDKFQGLQSLAPYGFILRRYFLIKGLFWEVNPHPTLLGFLSSPLLFLAFRCKCHILRLGYLLMVLCSSDGCKLIVECPARAVHVSTPKVWNILRENIKDSFIKYHLGFSISFFPSVPLFGAEVWAYTNKGYFYSIIIGFFPGLSTYSHKLLK